MSLANVVPFRPPGGEPWAAPEPVRSARWIYTPAKPEPSQEVTRTDDLWREDSNSTVNRSMMLAERADFFSMCHHSLWGTESKEEFGEFLRSVVEAFLPKTAWDLELLTSVADLQWKIKRKRKMQRGLYEEGSKKRGSSGFQIRVETTNAVEESLDALQRSLSKAIQNYKLGKS